jgi:stage V sporulation protein G
MNITDVKVRLINKGTKMKGAASITLDNEFAIHDIKIIDGGDKGLFVAMPSRETYNKVTGVPEFRDVAHPINSEVRNKVNKLVMDEYKKEVARGLTE